MKLAGAKIAMMVRLIAITASPISSAASSAARYADLPIRMCRTMFSISTIASSTRMPVLSVIASRLMRLSEKPEMSIAQNDGKIDNGSVRAGDDGGANVAQEGSTMMAASAAPSNRVWIAAS